MSPEPPRAMAGSAPLRRSQLLPLGTPSPAGLTAKTAATRDPGLCAPHPPRPGPGARTCLRWRTLNRSLGKAAAHRGRMSSPPEDLCPSRAVTVTHARRHRAARLSLAESSAEPERHRVLLATLSPPPAAPSPSVSASAQEDPHCAGAIFFFFFFFK